jgi:outer membrane protein assembly factor BamE (lipoprotein component of BamABCDE complex)
MATQSTAASRRRHDLLSPQPQGRSWQRIGAASFVLLLVAGGVLFWVSSGSASKVTPENYARVQIGMTEAEVRAILGEPAGQRKADRPGVRTLGWRQGNDMVVVTFRHDKVVRRSATFRNKPDDRADRARGTISAAVFRKLRPGTSFAEVKQLLGPPTREEAGNLPLKGVSFRMAYWERGFDNVSLQFTDDRLNSGLGAIDGKMLAVGPSGVR